MCPAFARRIRPLPLACILLAASILPALDYGFGPGEESLIARRDIHQGIVNRTSRAPDRYRWLAAAIVEAPVRVLTPIMGFDRAFDRVSAVFYLLAIAAMLWSLFACLRLWFPDDLALMPPLIVSCTMRIAMRQHDYAPYSFLEPTFFALALIAIVRRRDAWFAALVAIASFNRETAIFLVLLYFVTSDGSRRALLRTALYGATWAAIFIAVRVVTGEAERYWTIERVFRTNMAQPQLAAVQLGLLLGVFWLFASFGWRHAPSFIRRASLIIPAYLATVAVWGIWWEVRLVMPMYPLIFALGLSYLESVEWRAGILTGILATAVAVNAFDYSVLVPQPELRSQMHAMIVDGTAPVPERYRVLIPWLLDPVIAAASTVMAPDQAFRRVYAVFHFAALTAMLAGVYAYCRLWFTRSQAVIAALIVGTSLRLVLRMGEYWDFAPIPAHSWFAPWSLLEPVWMACGLIAAYKRQWPLLFAIAAGAAASSVAASLVLALSGPEPTLAVNLAQLPTAAINVALFLGPAALVAAAGFARSPIFARRAAAVGAPLVVALLLFAEWRDVRLLTPLYPLAAPLVLAATFSFADRPPDYSPETPARSA